MANMKGKDQKATQSPETVICEFLGATKNEKAAAESSAKALMTQQTSKETIQGYKICCLDKAEESNDFYQDILTCITLGNYKKTTIIQQNVDTYITKDDEIEKLIKDSSILLNTLRVKMEEAHNEACAMSNCVKNKLFPKKGNPTKGDNKNKIIDCLNEIMEKTKSLDEKGQNAFDSMVTLAGLQTFTNTGSLKAFVTAFVDSIKIFKDCIDANVTSTWGEVVTFKAELNAITEELAQTICDKQAQINLESAMDHMVAFICESNCDGECLDLCKELKNCFDGKDEGDGDNQYQNKKRQSQDQN